MNTELYDLTNPQKSIWLTEQFYKGTAINNIVAFLEIKESPNIDALKAAFNILIKNNDSYRIRITLINNKPMQYFADYTPIGIDTININNEKEYEDFKNSFSSQPLTALDSQLFNVKILSFPDGSAILALSIHHLIGDAWTISLSLEEELKYYNYILNSLNSTEVRPSYQEFIENQYQYFNGDKFKMDTEFWENYFNSAPETLILKESDSMNTHSDRLIYTFSDTLTKKMNVFCKNNGISDYIFLLAVFSIYFRNIYNSKNFIIGNPVLNRANFREKQTTGMFISTMPFYIEVDDSLSFLSLCRKISNDQRTMYRHLRYPVHNIVDFIRDKYGFSGQLFDIVFSYQNSPVPSYAKWIPNHCQAESLQIHIKSLSTEKSPDLSIHYDYLTDVFSKEQIASMHNRIENMILQILDFSDIPISNIEIITKEELNEINHFNDTTVEYNKNSNIPTEFEKIVCMYPNKTAVKDSSTSLTYDELNNRANYLANIINNLNSTEDIIAFALPRSVNIFVAILAILKSGNTYMPIDPEYPINRINFMLQNSNANILITTKEFSTHIHFSGKIIFYEDLLFDKEYENLEIAIPSDKKAYIMYTSGSTGVPKAVTIKHYNVLNFVKSIQMKLNYTPSDDNIVLSVTTVCFDIFVFETFPTLLSGLTLIIATEFEAKSPKLLSELIINNNISKILTTPSRIDLLLSDEKYTKCLSNINEFLLGGEPLSRQLIDTLKKYTSAHIYDLYGPTETTVYSTFNDVTFADTISIGKPINNTQIYIFNENNKMLPINTIGEICIAGDGVGDGYYNDPEKTDTVFIKNPYGNGTVYKTGDLGMWTSSGMLMCHGRKDNQIKIRGYRIELDDIVNNILLFKGIEKCVVVDFIDSNDKKYLCAYFVAKRKINTTILKKYLVNLLPNYMIPSYLVQLDCFPLTLNHKIDKKSLPIPTLMVEQSHKYIAPTTETEKILCDAVQKALNIEQISAACDLFDYNIDSLDIIKIQTKLLTYNIQINTQDFYKYRTIKELAKFSDSNIDSEPQSKENKNLYNINKSFVNHNIPVKMQAKSYNNILLTGGTGYLGIHILHDLLTTYSANIICTVRQKNTVVSAKQRLEDLYKFYFDETIDFSRVSVVSSDITKPLLGLSSQEYTKSFNNLDLIINVAANVRYYGHYSEFKKTNIDVVGNLIQLALATKAHLVHISTLGLSGNYLTSNDSFNKTFSENDFYIGQSIDENVYIKTKFEAEKLIYEKASEGLNSCIIRVGNLTGRFSDGHFQKNINENAFYNILRLILKYKIIPKTILDKYLELTPVDYCSKGILKLLYNFDTEKRVFHLFNNNYIKICDLLKIFSNLGFDISLLDGNTFKTEIVKLANLYPDENIIKGIINELDDNLGVALSVNVQQLNNITNSYLSKLDFTWPTLDNKYIEKLINYMRRNKYI